MKSGTAHPKPRRYTQTARAQSTEATARRTVDSFLARLLTQWFDEITLDRVAADAGVTVQTIVRRFGGKRGLLAEAIKVLAPQIRARRAATAGDVDRLIASLLADYESVGDAMIRLLALEHRQPVLKEFLNIGRAEHRTWVAAGLAGPLTRLDASARERVLDALVIIMDVYTWQILRRDMGRSLDQTAATMKLLIENTLREHSGSQTTGEAP